jgi:hypothetical protein
MWVDGWMHGWMGVKNVLRDCLAQSKNINVFIAGNNP